MPLNCKYCLNLVIVEDVGNLLFYKIIAEHNFENIEEE